MVPTFTGFTCSVDWWKYLYYRKYVYIYVCACLMQLYVSVLPGFLWSVCSHRAGVTVPFPRLVCRGSMLCPDKTSTLSTTNGSQAALQQNHCSNHLHVPGGIAAWQFQLESVGFLHFHLQPSVMAETSQNEILVWLMSDIKEANTFILRTEVNTKETHSDYEKIHEKTEPVT